MCREAKTIGVIGLWLSLLATGCHRSPTLRAAVELSPEYRRALVAWTASGSLYNQVDRRMEIYALLFTPGIRQEFSRRYLELFGVEISAGRGELEANILKAEGKAAALVLMECEDYRLCDIGGKDSVWKLLFKAGAETVLPAKIHHLRTPRPTLQGFFPFAGNFHRAFWVEWPLGAEVLSGACSLLVTSPYGKLELGWPAAGGES
jgi:hypothetical protein